MNKITLFFTIVLILFLHSCRSARQVPTAADMPTPLTPMMPIAKLQTADEIIMQSIHQRSNFDWFSANIGGTINLAGDRNNFGGQIRIKNGEAIWISITAFGLLEVIRLKITTDSVFLFNRLERPASTTIRDFSFFKEMTGVDFTFDMLQDILVGNYFLGEPNNEFSYEFFEGNFLFTDNRPIPVGDVTFSFILSDAHYKFLALTLQDRNNRSVRIDYDNYTLVDENLFPQNLWIRMAEPVPFELRLTYSRIQINVPQTMPFTIPRSAQRN